MLKFSTACYIALCFNVSDSMLYSYISPSNNLTHRFHLTATGKYSSMLAATHSDAFLFSLPPQVQT